MHISIEHFDNQFNVRLSSKEGVEPFLVIKACRVVSGPKGDFVSFPARKSENGKWFNYVYASEKFQVAVLDAYNASKPKAKKAAPSDDMDDVPF